MPTQTRDTNGQHHAMPHQRLHGFVKGSVSFKIVLLSYYPLNGIFLFKPINIFHKINVELNVFFGKDAQRDLVGLFFVLIKTTNLVDQVHLALLFFMTHGSIRGIKS